MSVPQIRLKTKDFRAIANADIIIDGITVVAGENGSGKSTLSKLLYFVFKTACNYERLVEEELRRDMKDVLRFLEEVVIELEKYSNNKNNNKSFIVMDVFENLYVASRVDIIQKELFTINREKGFLVEGIYQRLQNVITVLKDIHNRISQSNSYSEKYSTFSSKFSHILSNLLGEKIGYDHLGTDVYDKITNLVSLYYGSAYQKIKNRPVEIFENAMYTSLSGIVPKQFEVAEKGSPIVKNGMDFLSKTYTVQNTIYTDTPMSIGVKDSGNHYWDDLNDLLLIDPLETKFIYNGSIKDVINGEANIDFDILSRKRFMFKRSDGVVFNLLDCATGIKSFAMLQILLNNGSLNEKTLLIIDEPEVHLHPKWIVEYARIIVKLNKEMGIKFFIASHDPDFISAIRYISEKEGNLDKVNFYLAEKEGDTFTYNYRHLLHNIDPIFKSFNIAISKIEEYGA